jgi:hypothetical protein
MIIDRCQTKVGNFSVFPCNMLLHHNPGMGQVTIIYSLERADILEQFYSLPYKSFPAGRLERADWIPAGFQNKLFEGFLYLKMSLEPKQNFRLSRGARRVAVVGVVGVADGFWTKFEAQLAQPC